MKISGLTKKGLLSIGVVCLIVFGVCILLASYNTKSGMKAQIEANINDKVSLTAEKVSAFFDHYGAIGSSMAGNANVQKMVNESISVGDEFINHPLGHNNLTMLNSIADNDENMMAIYITSEFNQDLIMSGDIWTSKDLPGFIVGERPWYLDAKAKKGLIVCNPYLDAVTGQIITAAAVPIMTGGEVKGVIGMDITLDTVNEIIRGCAIGEDSEVVAILPDGTIFYSTNEISEGEYEPVEDMSADLAAYLADENASGVMQYKHDGTTYLGAKCSIGDTGWVVFTSISKSEAYRAVTACTAKLTLLLVVAWLITCALVSITFRNLAVKPVNILKEKADLMAEGLVDLDIHYFETPNDEIQAMTNSICDVLENSKKQAAALEAVAAGNMDAEINVRSEKDIVNVSLKKVVDTLNAVDSEIERMSNALAEGQAAVRADANLFQGMFCQLASSVNGAIDNIMGPLKKIADSVDALGKGELLTIENDQKGDFHEILDHIQVSINNVKALVADTEELAEAAISGNLEKRADESKHSGEFKNVVTGINKTLDMVVEKSGWYETILNSVDAPIVVSNLDGSVALLNNAFKGSALMNSHCDVVNLFKSGTTTCEVEAGEEIYVQKTVEIKDAAGSVTGYVSSLNEVTSIQRPAAYSAREIERIQSNLEKMANGDFNFNKNKEIPDEYCKAVAKQYGMIEESIDKVAESVANLVKDSRAMADAAQRGDLSYRVDANVHAGEYREVMEGLNNTVNLLLRPVEEAVEVLEQMAIGNLTAKMEGNYAGEHNKIKSALNGTLENLRATIREIDRVLGAMAECNFAVNVNSAEFIGDFGTIGISLNNIINSIGGAIKEINNAAVQVSGGSKQLSTAAQNLADGSTKQASSIEEITNSMKEIATVTESNTLDATRASEMSTAVMNNAKAGNAKMKEMLESMNQINEASASISKVIKVIDDIAFQTNILALNAAVEAARAGVHGKGFAVVADEVRNLAAKSASAVQDTTSLIEGSISKAEQGTVIANEAAAAFEDIVNGITETSNLCDAIAEVSKEQEGNVVNVNGAIENVSGVIQSNSATAEESAAQSEELYAQANLLSDLVSKFKIAGGDNKPQLGGPTAPVASPAAKDVPTITLPDLDDLDFGASDKY